MHDSDRGRWQRSANVSPTCIRRKNTDDPLLGLQSGAVHKHVPTVGPFTGGDAGPIGGVRSTSMAPLVVVFVLPARSATINMPFTRVPAVRCIEQFVYEYVPTSERTVTFARVEYVTPLVLVSRDRTTLPRPPSLSASPHHAKYTHEEEQEYAAAVDDDEQDALAHCTSEPADGALVSTSTDELSAVYPTLAVLQRARDIH